MDTREKMTRPEREAWRATADVLDKCRTGAQELGRMMADAQDAARDAALFMLRITSTEVTPD